MTNEDVVMSLLDEEFKEAVSGSYEFCWSELAEAAKMTQRQVIQSVNSLVEQEKLLFVEALHAYGNGDYLVRYE